MSEDIYSSMLEDANRNKQKEYEYERRLVTSLSIGSGAGLAALITFSSNYPNALESYFYTILPSLWGFFIAIMLSGSLPLVFLKKYKSKSQYNNASYNVLTISDTREKFIDKYTVQIQDQKYEYVLKDLTEKFENQAEDMREYSKKQKFWIIVSRLVLFGAIVAFVSSVLWPLILITMNGKIV